MSNLVGRIKNFAIGQMARQAVGLMTADSDKNPIRVVGLLEKLADKLHQPDRKGELEFVKRLFETGHPFIQWIKRIGSELSPRVRDRFTDIVIVKAHFTSKPTRDRFKEKQGFSPPTHLVISPTMRCNLHCEGCWAAKYARVPDMEMELLERIILEARDEMGINFFTITGGEPFIRKDLFDLYEKFSDCYFHIYTNGTLITEEDIEKMAELGNVAPMISVEGGKETTDARRGKGVYDRVTGIMRMLHSKGIFFGFSITETRHNAEEISSEAFVDEMLKRGCFNGWYFQYIPIGLNPNPSLMITPEQRDMVRRRIYMLRNSKPIFLVDFWNDGPAVNGCMAGGKRYLHINARGDVEPCVFAHFACDNIREKSLTEILKSPFFRAIREGIPYDGNTLRACMIVDRPEYLRDYCKRFNAYPTHEGAETIITQLREEIDRYAQGVAEIFDRAWQEGDWIKLFYIREPREGEEDVEIENFIPAK